MNEKSRQGMEEQRKADQELQVMFSTSQLMASLRARVWGFVLFMTPFPHFKMFHIVCRISSYVERVAVVTGRLRFSTLIIPKEAS